MAIISWPDDVLLAEVVSCAACHRRILLSEATAGLLRADGEQTFACERHFGDGVSFLRAWADFNIKDEISAAVRLVEG